MKLKVFQKLLLLKLIVPNYSITYLKFTANKGCMWTYMYACLF